MVDKCKKIRATYQIIKDIERRKREVKEFLKSGRNILVISPYKEVKIRYTGEHLKNGQEEILNNEITMLEISKALSETNGILESYRDWKIFLNDNQEKLEVEN